MNNNPLREELGRAVRLAWVAYCRATGDEKPSHIAPWEELSEWDQEADRRIGVAVANLVTYKIIQQIENLAHFGYDPAVIKSPYDILMDAADRLRRLPVPPDGWGGR